jgi:hypothetical protein
MAGDPDPKPPSSKKQKRTPEDAVASERFKRMVLVLDGRCLVHDDERLCAGPLQAHHVVSQQQLRHAGLHELLWMIDNGMTVCESAHSNHTSASRRIPGARIPLRCIRFAELHGFADTLTRYYP